MGLEDKLGTENDLFSLDYPREGNSNWSCVCVHSFLKYDSGQAATVRHCGRHTEHRDEQTHIPLALVQLQLVMPTGRKVSGEQ